MPENDSEFKEKVKISFSKAKEDISELKNEIKELKELILAQGEEINLIKMNKVNKLAEELKRGFLDEEIQKVSSGNEGVVALTHSLTHDAHTTRIDDIRVLKKKFEDLPKQKLALYLTIYNLEDQKLPTTYISLAKSLKITEEGIRNYITFLNRKEIPLDKHRVNNKVIVFKIPEVVRSLNLKQYLEDLYYGTDSSQGRLTDM